MSEWLSSHDSWKTTAGGQRRGAHRRELEARGPDVLGRNGVEDGHGAEHQRHLQDGLACDKVAQAHARSRRRRDCRFCCAPAVFSSSSTGISAHPKALVFARNSALPELEPIAR